MSKITVDAYDTRHPEHEKLLDFECDTGLDISLLPTFNVEIDVADDVALSLLSPIAGSVHGG